MRPFGTVAGSPEICARPFVGWVYGSVCGGFVEPAGKPADHERTDPGAQLVVYLVVAQADTDPAAKFQQERGLDAVLEYFHGLVWISSLGFSLSN